jgi:hypothetical protein
MNRTRTVFAFGVFAGVWLVLTACGSSDAFLSGRSSGAPIEKCQLCGYPGDYCCTNPFITNCCSFSACVSTSDCDNDNTPLESSEEGGVDDDGGGGGDDGGGGGISDSGGGGGGAGGSICTSPPPGGE